MGTVKSAEEFRVAVIDGPIVGWVIDQLNNSPELLNFFDVASIIEAIVLHDKVQLLFPDEIREPEQEFLNIAQEALGPLERAGVVEFVFYPDPEAQPEKLSNLDHKAQPDKPANTSKRKKKKKSWKKRKGTHTIDAENDFMAWFMFQTVRFAIAERSSIGNAVVLPCQSLIYKLNRRVKAEHSICNLYLNYESVRKLAQLARLASSGTDTSLDYSTEYWKLTIPPLCLDTLARCTSIDKIWPVTGVLWDEHASLRKRHQMLSAVRSDKEHSPAARARETKKIKQDWDRLVAKWRARVNSFKLADTTNDLRQATGLLGDAAGLQFSNTGDIALDPSAPLKWAQLVYQVFDRVRGYWRLRRIHDSLEAYWKVNDYEMYGHIQRLLNRPITKEDHEDLVRIESEEKDHLRHVVIDDLFPD